MKKIDADIKLHNKAFEDMELEELYAEKSARKWHRSKMKRNVEILERRRHWLEENIPICSKEGINRQYENGEITQNQYKSAFGRRKLAINNRMKNEDRIAYAQRLAYHEEAIVAYIDELITEKLAKKHQQQVQYNKAHNTRRKKHDPRKPDTKYNRSKASKSKNLDPNRKWETRKDTPYPKLQGAKARWRRGKADDTKALTIMKRMQPIVTWDIEKLMQVTRDRGFYTEVAVIAAIAESLNTTVGGTKKMLDSGRLTWSQCIIIGAIFEMTPKEFCDVFLSGYFKEVADGVFKAQLDNINDFLDIPYQPRPRFVDEEEEKDGV